MKIELKEIDRDSLKVGDVVGAARKVQLGCSSSFQHDKNIPAMVKWGDGEPWLIEDLKKLEVVEEYE